jgi:hypothetical protein
MTIALGIDESESADVWDSGSAGYETRRFRAQELPKRKTADPSTAVGMTIALAVAVDLRRG